MNLEDLLDESGLQQDEWSLTAPTFGKEGQISVVGWSGKQRTHKYYILKCIKCSHDNELFGGGYFRSPKSSLVNLGSVPCGCSKSPRFSEKQYEVLCSRKAEEIDYKFLGFVGEWKTHKTKIKMLCEKHGEWVSSSINGLISKGRGCPSCNGGANPKPDNFMIQSFFASGAFHPETEFWRSERRDTNGAKVYWYMYCPDCDQIAEALSISFQSGSRPCGCRKHRQQQCAINLVIDSEFKVVAIKFGVANDSYNRVKSQNRGCCYDVKNFTVYTFPDIISCRKAERQCKQELDCGILSKEEMPDGWTETTNCRNLPLVLSIFQSNGGKELIEDHQLAISKLNSIDYIVLDEMSEIICDGNACFGDIGSSSILIDACEEDE